MTSSKIGFHIVVHTMSLAATPGSITITAVAMLTFPRALEPSKGPKNKVFDVNLNIRDGQEDTTLGLLRYFVPDNLMNAVEKIEDFTQVFFVATISAMPPSGPADKTIATQDIESWSEYAFIGDIIQLIFIENVDNAYEPYINLSGTVTESNRDESSFSMRPSQYINLLHGPCEFPAHLLITNSKRWANKKPLPAVGSGVSIGGFLHGVHRHRDRSISTFDIDVSNIAYITNRIQSTADSAPSQSHNTRSRTRFNFKAQRSSAPKHSPDPSPPSEHTFLKRKRANSEESETEKEEGNKMDGENKDDEENEDEETPTKRSRT